MKSSLSFLFLPLLAAPALAVSTKDVATYDANGDHFATYAEMSAVLPGFTRSDFRRLDENDDWRVSAEELNASGVQSVIGRYTGMLGTIALEEIDLNHDHFVGRAELAKGFPGVSTHDWNMLDRNGDNRLSVVEFNAGRSTLARYGGVMDEAIVSLNSIDLDGSHFASFDEVRRAYPDISRVDFDRLDLDNDSRISFDELYVGQAEINRR